MSDSAEETPVDVMAQITEVLSEIDMLDGFKGRSKTMAGAHVAMRCQMLGTLIVESELDITDEVLLKFSQAHRRIMVGSWLHVIALTAVGG